MLIYSKGAYILHMLEMMYWSRDAGDRQFKVAMHDFVNSYRNKAATTEDFKAVMERNLPAWADIDHNHKLDWFFNEYVYGTQIPKYTATSEVTRDGDDAVLHFKVSQSGVSDDFEMLMPIYLEFEDKHVAFLGRAKLTGSGTVDQTVKLGKVAGAKRVVVNYNFDLLAE
jgi:aminopeptidase N